MAFIMPFGGALSLHLGLYNQCSLPQVPALGHTNRLMTLQRSNWKKDNHLASSKTSFFSNDFLLFISGLCIFHSHQRCNRLIVAADSDYYSVIGVSEMVSAYWKLARQYHPAIDETLGRRCIKLKTIIKNDQFVPLIGKRKSNSWVCFAGGPRPRKPRVWKSRIRRGTVSKAAKLVDCVKALSNIKEEVYGALDSFIAWEIEFPLITVKKALKTLRAEKEWKRIIQIIKWMFSKGQGKTMGNYFLLLHALAEEERIEEAEELWMQIFTKHLEHVPRVFFTRIITMYDKSNLPEKLLEVFADMEELGVKPDYSSVLIVAKTFKNLGMLDKCDKVLKKYPQPDKEYRYYKGKRVKVRRQKTHDSDLIPLSESNSTTLDKEEDTSEDEDEDEDESTVYPFFANEDIQHQMEISQPLQEREHAGMNSSMKNV